MKGNPSEAAQITFWLIFNQILIENERKSVWGLEHILMGFQLYSNWKWKEIRMSQPRADSDWFLIKRGERCEDPLSECLALIVLWRLIHTAIQISKTRNML